MLYPDAKPDTKRETGQLSVSIVTPHLEIHVRETGHKADKPDNYRNQ